MLIEKEFYTVKEFKELADNNFLATLTLNKEHHIFEGHFPGQPVTPGVCMMQIIKELSEEWSGSILRLKTARNIKFMAIINPDVNADIQVELAFDRSSGELIVKSTASFEDTVALKFSGVFEELSI